MSSRIGSVKTSSIGRTKKKAASKKAKKNSASSIKSKIASKSSSVSKKKINLSSSLSDSSKSLKSILSSDDKSEKKTFGSLSDSDLYTGLKSYWRRWLAREIENIYKKNKSNTNSKNPFKNLSTSTYNGFSNNIQPDTNTNTNTNTNFNSNIDTNTNFNNNNNIQPDFNTPTPTPSPDGDNVKTTRESFLNQINAFRRSKGLPEVTIDEKLCNASQGHSDWMKQNNNMSHQQNNSQNGHFTQRIRNAGFGGSPMGECIANGARNAEQAFTMWKNSPGHNAIMSNSSINKIGIAYNGSYWTLTTGRA